MKTTTKGHEMNSDITPHLTSRWEQEARGKDDAMAGRTDGRLMAQSIHYRKGHEYGERLLRARADMWAHMDEETAQAIAEERL
jgi:hypothetical protein